MSETTLVIGARGKVGRPLVRGLTAAGHEVRAATRHPDQYDVAGGEPVEFDYDRPETIRPALEGVDRIFMMARDADPKADLAGAPLVDLARESGIRRLVLMTAMGVEQADDAPLRKLEKYVVGSGLAYSFLRPNWFMQNYHPGAFSGMIKQSGEISLPAGDGKISYIDTGDIAAVAEHALSDPSHEGKEYTLTGGEAIDHYRVAELISAAAGHEIPYRPITDEQMRETLKSTGMPEEEIDLLLILFGDVRAGEVESVSTAVEDILERPPQTFEEFAQRNADAWR